MRIESKLCHLSENKAVVLVNGWLNEKYVGSALAEGTTVETAEDKAISRLTKRLSTNTINVNNINLKNENIENNDNNGKAKIEDNLFKKDKLESLNVNEEPNDWSNDLTAIDSEIKRLNWNRNDEIKFLEKTLGYKSRNKITKYTELIKYLNILKKIDNTNLDSLSMQAMIEESDTILKDLSWDNNQGRIYLKQEFNVTTRKELDEEQLKLFVSKLKLIKNQLLSK